MIATAIIVQRRKSILQRRKLWMYRKIITELIQNMRYAIK